MTPTYINPEEFNKQLIEKNISVEALAEILTIEISTAKIIFSGHKAISNLEILKLHELAGFSYPNLLTIHQTIDYEIYYKKHAHLRNYNPTNDRELRKILLPVTHSTNCGKCDFLIITPVNYCPYCATAIPQFINRTDITMIENEPSDELLYLNTIAFNTRINQLELSIHTIYLHLNLDKSDFINVIKGKKALLKEEQEILNELLSAPIGYFAGRAIE